MPTEDISIAYKDKKIPAVYNRPEGDGNGHAIILTHGAGGNMHNTQIQAVAEHLADKGYLALRFTVSSMNIGYRIKVYNAVLDYLRENNSDLKGCILSGRSMGARAAVGVANEVVGSKMEDFVKGVACLAYPLHPQGEPDNLRDGPLKTLSHPILFISGTRDEMADKDLMDTAVSEVPSYAQIHWIEGADHSHKINRFKDKEVNTEIFKVLEEWCQSVVDGKRKAGEKKKKSEKAEKKADEKVSSSEEEKKGKKKKVPTATLR